MAVDAELVKEKLMNELRSGRLVLPGLPDIAMRVRKAIAQESADVAKVTKIIQTDIPLAARLIQVANSPLYRGVIKVETCQSAVSRLGLDVTRNLVLSFSMRRVFTAKSARTRKRVEALWKHSVKVAAIAYVLARITPDLDPDKALLSALIHDIGVLPITHFIERDPEIEDDDETYHFLIDRLRSDLGLAILQQWRFDPFYHNVVTEAENWNRNTEGKPDYADVIIVSQKHAEYGEKKRTIDPVPAMQKFPVFRLGKATSIELITEAQDEINELRKLLSA